VVLTRYDGLGGAAARVPIGLTVPESVELMTALGAYHAVMLDGGISAQMLMRQEDGVVYKWNGLRNVPLALIARPRAR
jgi:exopolysaccharide biosynthesis protein